MRSFLLKNLFLSTSLAVASLAWASDLSSDKGLALAVKPSKETLLNTALEAAEKEEFSKAKVALIAASTLGSKEARHIQG